MRIIRLSNMAGFTSAPLNSFSIFRVKHYLDEHIKYAAFHSADDKLLEAIKSDPGVLDRLEVKDAGGDLIDYFRIVRSFTKNTSLDSLVVHGHQPGSSIVGLFALTFLGQKIPFVYTVHNSLQNFPLFKRVLLYICFCRADRITFVSQSAFDSFAKFMHKSFEKKAVVIQNGVDLERIDNAINGYPLSPFVSDGSINIVCIGRLAPQKNLPFLIRVMSMLPKNVRLYVFGEGSLRAELQSQVDLAGLQGRVELSGNISRDDLFRFLKVTDLYVSVANYEGLPMALMEALAVGKPCLASDIQPHHEIQKLVPSLELLPFEELLWVKAINQMITKKHSERDEIGKHNRMAIEKVLTMQLMQDKYREIYNNVIKIK